MERILVYGMTDNPGGIEAYLLNTAKRLREDIRFDFVSDFPDIAHRSELESMGSKVFFIPAKGKDLFGHWKSFADILKKHPEYKTVYFNLLDAGGAFTELIPWLFRRRIVTHSHNNGTDKLKLHKLCRPFLKLFTSSQIACSKVAANYMFGDNNRATVIPNAIKTEDFIFDKARRDNKRAELGIGERSAVCHVGRLSMQKNPFRMLDIFSELLKTDPNAVLLSVGTGELEKDVHAYADEKGISKSVMFLGCRNDVPDILQAADVFFLPSLYEGLPICLLEAQASGLFSVASDEITTEADITGLVKFISLKKSDAEWAQELLAAAGAPRKDTLGDFISAGYDNSHCEAKNKELLRILENQRGEK